MPCNVRIDAPGATANLNTFKLHSQFATSGYQHFLQVGGSAHLAAVINTK